MKKEISVWEEKYLQHKKGTVRKDLQGKKERAKEKIYRLNERSRKGNQQKICGWKHDDEEGI